MTQAVVPPPKALREAIDRLRSDAVIRYGDALIDVSLTEVGLLGTVALPGQAEGLMRLAASLWPQSSSRLLVLATRRPRVALYPDVEPLDVWRRRTGGVATPQELTTQLLPGDPPAGLLAVRNGQYLVKAPGEAVGWVEKTARFRFGAVPCLADPATGIGWDPTVVRQTALDLLGRPYVFGGTGGQGIDCSGLSWRAFLAAGVLLPRNSRAQRQVGDRVRLAELQESDIICAVHRGPKRTSHVALYLGEDEVVHACSEWNLVRRERLGEFRDRYQVLTVRRVPGAIGHPR
ncbi:MAG: C40 family peptidase [Candidatus Dormibacteria bacterium]